MDEYIVSDVLIYTLFYIDLNCHTYCACFA